MDNKIIFYAPNIHVGGGYILLKEVLKEWPKNESAVFFLDKRIKKYFSLDFNSQNKIYWVKNSIFSRLINEIRISLISKENSTLICFHGIPPLIANYSYVIVFFQNRILLGIDSILKFPIKTRIRLFFERWIAKTYAYKVDEYIVQTKSMAFNLRNWLNKNNKAKINLFPFFNFLPFNKGDELDKVKLYDFIYVSGDESHKNHINLLKAWELLSEKNIYPLLALTVPKENQGLNGRIADINNRKNLKIVNLGSLQHNNILRAYKSSQALIFPSYSESFGLPLIEAGSLDMPIIASEMDFVRDVCNPKETFDPHSPLSICNAVLRFMNEEDELNKIHSCKDFNELLISKRID
jgi:hypothetical protein